MKTYILFFMLCVSMVACKSTKDTIIDNTPVVETEQEITPQMEDAQIVEATAEQEEIIKSQMNDETPPITSASIITISMVEYYTKKTENGKDEYTRHEKEGSGVERMNGEFRLMDVTLKTGEKFTCQQVKHPDTGVDIYLKIGGTTPENEH